MYAIVFILMLTCAKSDYVLDNRKCKWIDLWPFDNETAQYYEKRPYVHCTQIELLSFIERKDNITTLNIKDDAILKYVDRKEDLHCSFMYVRRSGFFWEPDTGISNRIYFNRSAVLTEETVRVECYDDITSQLVYQNVHHIIMAHKIKQTSHRASLNVLFVVIDSVSRNNLIRTMPSTYKFLKKIGFVDLKSYNKVNLNTFPNAIALLTGYNLEQANRLCDPSMIGGLDKCPMIWNDFERLGYVTAYAEDWSTINTFNYEKKGFLHPPTTYYYKPYMEASEELGKFFIDTMPYCAGPENAAERIFNLALDFTKSFQKKQPSFGMFWLNTFSHNDVSSPTRMDAKTHTFFEKLKDNGVLDDTVVFFLSDHGVRFGNICRTSAGYFEERQPFNLISVPINFSSNLHNALKQLRLNKEQLISTYDIYMTLQHVLQLINYNHTVRQSAACETCQSIFKQIPIERSCKEAGIDDVWCSCIGKLFDIRVNHPLVIENIVELQDNIGQGTVVRARLSEIVMERRFLLLDFKKSDDNAVLLNVFLIYGNSQKGSLKGTFKFT